jgi:hypothetical protein
MKSSGVITLVGGVGALALLGLSLVLRGDEPETPARPGVSSSRAGAGSPSARGAAPRLADAPSSVAGGTAAANPGTPRPPAALAPPGSTTGMSPSGGAEAAAQAPGPEGSAVGQAGTGSGPAQASEVEKTLEVARKAPREDERINALRWLGANATPAQFEALQDIQIHDSSPEVRKAAELAANELRTRRAQEAWPGVTPKTDPQDYMRGVASPSP